ncbi:uncharacterized protein LOC131883271 [Tigriopus californicus]|uniref:uncharacterized protein LOC131883271 n=1 Tax=Tigriopus californicus TaxID=6832 RepID=UPI0027D9E072|nr:uncharacterized protein LOC131883271 [Tigriopus californicus]XP_059086690.1 uncharacterized protein LOC131883271 [Tigriopus californicus]
MPDLKSNFGRFLCSVAIFEACVHSTTINAKQELKSWFADFTDLKYDCKRSDTKDVAVDQVDAVKMEGPGGGSGEIFSIVDCSQRGAIFGYNYQSMEKSKVKRGPFNGHGILTFPSHINDHGKFKHGFRTGRCLSISHPGIRSISGNFLADQLEGRVILQFKDDTILVGHAENNHLVGILRYFDMEQRRGFLNASAIDGTPLLSSQSNGYHLLSISTDDRVLLTKDFESFLTCQSTGNVYLQDCHQVLDMTIDRQQCDLSLRDIEQAPESFALNLLTNERSNADAGPLHSSFCANSNWQSNKTLVAMNHWLLVMQSHLSNPFWDSPFEGQALNWEDPTIYIELNHYKSRRGLNSFPCTISSHKMVLLKCQVRNGVIRAKVPRFQAIQLQQFWNNPVVISFETSLQSMTRGSDQTASFLTEENQIRHGLIGRLKNGRLHGPVRGFGRVSNDQHSDCGAKIRGGELAYIGLFKDGVPVGHSWRGLIGGAWIHGEVGIDGDFTGESITYVYPDMKTAFVGQFKQGIMISAQESEVTGEKCQNGIKILKFSSPTGPNFHYNPPTKNSFGDQPLLRDPLDVRYVHLKPSEDLDNAGEGAFAKFDVPSETTFSLYSGRILNDTELTNLQSRQKAELKEKNLTNIQLDAALQDLYKYRLNMETCLKKIDIPPAFGRTETYNATVGHKVNHHFLPSVSFTTIDSARFGIVMAMKTTRKVKQDEEYLVNYQYSPSFPLPWFQEMYRKFAREHPELVSEEILVALNNPKENITPDMRSEDIQNLTPSIALTHPKSE